MMTDSKSRNALSAINAVLIMARSMAYEGRSGELAVVLDIAEYLPLLMLEPTDQTENFRAHLLDLARRYPEFELAVRRFDAAE